jgi:cytidine deaminase
MTDREFIDLAEAAKENAYAPYSHFPVGAALECVDGTIFTGCNIENAALGSTICAERVAIFKAVSEGHQQFRRLAIASDGENYCTPCGACLQVLAEFSPDMEVLSTRADGRYVSHNLSKLLPVTFTLER